MTDDLLKAYTVLTEGLQCRQLAAYSNYLQWMAATNTVTTTTTTNI